jgi:hypothetical protein
MSTLRAKIIRLAHAKPELRPHLLPLVSREAAFRLPGQLGDRYSEKGDVKWGRRYVRKEYIMHPDIWDPPLKDLKRLAKHFLKYTEKYIKEKLGDEVVVWMDPRLGTVSWNMPGPRNFLTLIASRPEDAKNTILWSSM